MEKTIEGLKSRGVRVDVDLNRDTDVASYNVVLLYNFALKELMLNDAQRCLQAGVPYVVQTMYEDWPKFFGQMTGSAQLIDHYLKLGQRRETWPQFEKVLKRIEPTGIWDNTFSATNAACLIATGHEEARVLTRDYPGANVRVIHYGQEAAPAGDGGELFFQESGLRDYVLCVGRLESRKNQHMLLKALEDSPLPLVFLGGGFSYQPEYAQVCERFKRLGDTVFLGRMSPELLASAFSGARVHALPSFYELPGLVSLEAAAYGTNIVVADYGTVRDYVGDYAFYCDPTDPQDIRRAVEAAYEAPKNPALQELVTSFSWERFYDQVLALFEEVASTGSELTEERPGC
jgi:glycosyltransferase involved in cell wall biosynthesis